jgi:hypothetical protein
LYVRELRDPLAEWIDTSDILVIHLARPLIYRVVFFLILLALLLFMWLLTMADSSVFIEGAIGLFLGIISVRELIIPAQVTTRIYLDTVLLGLYVLFLIPLGIHLYPYIIERRKPKLQTDEELLEALLIDRQEA